MIAESNTRVDWWIITRDTIFIICHLIILTIFLMGNNVVLWKSLILLTLYFTHIMLMKYNHVYEVAIKKTVARRMEIKELNRIARTDISHFHRNANSRALSIEQLCRVKFEVNEDDYIEFDAFTKRKIKPIRCVKIRDERTTYGMESV